MKDGAGAVSRVLLVGGTSEIGRAIVEALPLTPDARIWAAGRGDPRTTWVSPPAPVEPLPFDALDPAPPDQLFAAVTDDIDVIVVAVGVLGDQHAAEQEPALARDVAVANFAGLLPILLASAERLVHQGHGALVVLSSVAGVRTRRANFVYGASKAGLDAFALGLGDRLAGTGVDLLVVRPGFVHGRMTAGMRPAPFATTPAAVGAAVAARLRSDPAGVLWVPGQLRLLFGVLRVLPRSVFRRLPDR